MDETAIARSGMRSAEHWLAGPAHNVANLLSEGPGVAPALRGTTLDLFA